jgi:hypothetical protein
MRSSVKKVGVFASSAAVAMSIGFASATPSQAALTPFQSIYNGSLKDINCQMSSAPPGQSGWPSAIHCTYWVNPVFNANFKAIIAAAWKSPNGVKMWQQVARDRAAGIDTCERAYGKRYYLDRTNRSTRYFDRPVLGASYRVAGASNGLQNCLTAVTGMSSGWSVYTDGGVSYGKLTQSS